tara:strand:- start:12703 stop:15297 length:2595 start_codon:yes stop_codon:yes gene_type:complete
MKSLNTDLLNETMDADQGGSDFVDSLPTPEIKTTEELIAATTPAAPVATPAAPAPAAPPGVGMVASYSQPEYGPHGNVIDPGGKFLGYVQDTSQKYDAPKSAEILALEEKFGTTMDPVYATYKQDTRGASKDVEYGPPIGYRFDNGNSQYVSYDASGNYTGTQNREKPGAFGNVLMSVLAIAYPPLAPFIQAYNAVKAIDEGNVLSFIASAAGAGQSIPGLDKNTISLLKDVSTGAKIVQAVESKDPAKIFSAVVNLPNVDPDLKDLSIVVNTAKALNDGNISGAFNGILKMSDRDSIGRLTDKFNDIVDGQDVAALDPSQVAALNPPTEDQAAQDQADREQAGREAARSSDKTIEQTLIDSGLVSANDQLAAQEQADREQAARDAAQVSEKTIEQTLVDSGLVSDTNAQEQLAKEQENREQAGREAIRAQEQAAQLAQEQADREQAAQEKANRDQADLEAKQVAQEQADREQAARDAIRSSEKTIEQVLEDAGLVAPEPTPEPEPAPELTTKLEPVTVTEKAITDNELFLNTIAQEKADREQAAREAIRASEKTIEDQLTNAGLVSKTDDEKKLDSVDVTGKPIIDTDLPITDDQSRNRVTDSSVPITGDIGNNRVTDSSVPVNPNVGTTTPALEQKEVTGKAITDTDIPITDDLGRNKITDSSVPVNPNIGTTSPTLEKQTIISKTLTDTDLPITDDKGRNTVTDSNISIDPNVGTTDPTLEPKTITGKKIIEEEPTPNGGELEPKTIVGKRIIEEEPTPKPTIPVIPNIPTVPAKPAPAKPTPAKPTPVKPTPAKTATPAEQLYQTTTQSQPTTPTDIKYFIDMMGTDIFPPASKHDPLESLLNQSSQPMSLDELLRHLRK